MFSANSSTLPSLPDQLHQEIIKKQYLLPSHPPTRSCPTYLLYILFFPPSSLSSVISQRAKMSSSAGGKGGYFLRQVKVYTRLAMLSADCFRWQERQFFTGGAHTQGKQEERIFPPSCLSFTVFSSSFRQTHKWKNLVFFLFFRHTKEKTSNGVVKPRLLSSSNKGKHDVT